MRAAPEFDEVEVHVRAGPARAVGRAPLEDGIRAAAVATLDALDQLGVEHRTRVDWARLVDGIPDHRFLVVVSLVATPVPATRCYGLGTGASPIEAAARATLRLALGEPAATST